MVIKCSPEEHGKKEVPITYKVRTTGTSFITFKKYLGNVIPGIWNEMRRPVRKIREYPSCDTNE
jgi:hypothetical protein